jgi:hypothetical protein
VDHALSRMHLDRSAGSLQALPIANRVVEENFIFTYMNSDGRKPGQIGVQGEARGSNGLCSLR